MLEPWVGSLGSDEDVKQLEPSFKDAERQPDLVGRTGLESTDRAVYPTLDLCLGPEASSGASLSESSFACKGSDSGACLGLEMPYRKPSL